MGGRGVCKNNYERFFKCKDQGGLNFAVDYVIEQCFGVFVVFSCLFICLFVCFLVQLPCVGNHFHFFFLFNRIIRFCEMYVARCLVSGV